MGLRAISLSFVVDDVPASPPSLFATLPHKPHAQTSPYLRTGALRNQNRKKLDRNVWPETRHQLCWVHKFKNTLSPFGFRSSEVRPNDVRDHSNGGTKNAVGRTRDAALG